MFHLKFITTFQKYVFEIHDYDFFNNDISVNKNVTKREKKSSELFTFMLNIKTCSKLNV